MNMLQKLQNNNKGFFGIRLAWCIVFYLDAILNIEPIMQYVIAGGFRVLHSTREAPEGEAAPLN